MNISESQLSEFIRNFILETKEEEEKEVIGEPDESREDEREDPEQDIDEIMTLAGGGIQGFQGVANYDPENPRYQKKKKSDKK